MIQVQQPNAICWKVIRRLEAPTRRGLGMRYHYLGIAALFGLLAIASFMEKRRLEKKYPFADGQIIKEIKRDGADGFKPESAYLYEITRDHFWVEVAGFLIACFAAFLDFLSG